VNLFYYFYTGTFQRLFKKKKAITFKETFM